jgi:hypothetical protein
MTCSYTGAFFSDPLKSVSELVTYVPSTLSSMSDFCSPYDLILALFFNTMRQTKEAKKAVEVAKASEAVETTMAMDCFEIFVYF